MKKCFKSFRLERITTVPSFAAIRLVVFALAGALGLAVMIVLRTQVPSAPTTPATISHQYFPPCVGKVPQASVVGRVVWDGPVPTSEPIYGLIQTNAGPRWTHRQNPFMPRIHGQDRAIPGMVVSLQGIDPCLSEPWQRGPVSVESVDKMSELLAWLRKSAGGFPRFEAIFRLLTGFLEAIMGKDGVASLSFRARSFFTSSTILMARQDGRWMSVAFAKVGDEIDMVSSHDGFQAIRARGVSYFTLPFPEPNRPLRRTLDRPGRVEFTSAAGYFWTAVDVFVCEHPYYCITGSDGRFRLNHVPKGTYEITAWMRPWQIINRDRDPETGRIVRLHFADIPPARGQVTVPESGEAGVELRFHCGPIATMPTSQR